MVVALTPGLLLALACRDGASAPLPNVSACPWGEVSAVPSPLDPHAAVVTLRADRDGWATAGAHTGRAVRAGEAVRFVARDLAPSDDVQVRLDDVACATGLALAAPETPWAEVEGQPPHEGWLCLDVSRLGPYGTVDRFDCFAPDGRPVASLGWPDGATMDVPTFLADGRFAALRSRRQLGVFDETLGDDGLLFDLDIGDLPTRHLHDRIDRHELLPVLEGPWAGALALLTLSTDTVGDRAITANGAVLWSPEHGVLWDVSLHGDVGDGVPLDGLSYDREPLVGHFDPDWTHANSLAWHDGHLWMNLRAHDWLLGIAPDDDRVAWRVGFEGDLQLLDDDGAPLPASEWFFHAHAVQPLGDDRWLVYDNRNVTPDGDEREPSRVLELNLDLGAAAARPLWSYDPDGDDAFAVDTQGNAVPVDDHVAVLVPDTQGGPTVRVVARDGTVPFVLHVPGASAAYRVSWWPTPPGE